jgi:hypothetical protein
MCEKVIVCDLKRRRIVSDGEHVRTMANWTPSLR